MSDRLANRSASLTTPTAANPPSSSRTGLSRFDVILLKSGMAHYFLSTLESRTQPYQSGVYGLSGKVIDWQARRSPKRDGHLTWCAWNESKEFLTRLPIAKWTIFKSTRSKRSQQKGAALRTMRLLKQQQLMIMRLKISTDPPPPRRTA